MVEFNDKSSSPETRNGLPLGWLKTESDTQTMGFMSQETTTASKVQKQLLEYHGDSHLVTLGPTGSGKSRGAAIPALLSHTGPAVVVDVKGELYNTTARRRRELGQKIYKLDPWGLIDENTDALNPLDLLKLPGVDVEEEANMLAKLIAGADTFERDKFWVNTSQAINAGLIAYLATSNNDDDCRLSRAREMLTTDFPTTLALKLDRCEVLNKLAREEFAIFLQHPSQGTRPSVQSSAQQHFRLLGTDRIRRAMDSSTFSLETLTNHEAVTIYLIIPPHKLESHNSILRVWLGVLLQTLSRRTTKGQLKTLFLIDEAAALGTMEPLKQSITLLRGYGAQVWTFWQDVSQLQQLYPNDWQTIINNAGVVQLLSPRNLRMAEEYTALVGGISAEELLNMPLEQQLLITEQTRRAHLSLRLDYLHDALFKNKFDANPMFNSDGKKQINRKPSKKQSHIRLV